jgi:triosephosphate isomerase
MEAAIRERVESRKNLNVGVFLPHNYLDTAGQRGLLNVGYGVQEVHWATPGSHTGAVHAEHVLTDFPRIKATLVNHSEIIAEHGRTLAQAAGQVRAALNATVEGRTFRFITICVGEDRATYDRGFKEAAYFVTGQLKTILSMAEVRPEEMDRIGTAYEPRFAIQVGDIPGIPPTDGHIGDMGWEILRAAADCVGVDAMATMFGLQYGGSMKGPEDKVAPVQRFVGPGNAVGVDLYNGGLIGTAGKEPVVAAAILNNVVPV